jgi:hypothetical protein
MVKKIYTPPEIKQKYNDIETTKLKNSDYRVYIYEFIAKMKENYPESCLKKFYNNINTLKIKRDLFSILMNATAHYEEPINTIFIYNLLPYYYIKENLFHELLHVASTIYKIGLICSGFCQKTFNHKIGEGLTEGYTQLLTERLCEGVKLKTYKEEVRIATNLEEVIGIDKMQDLYFNANLPGLINEIAKYSSKEEATIFIMKIDYVHKNDKHFRTNARYEKNKERYKYIYNFLLEIYLKKKTKELKENIITEEVFVNDVAEYIKSCRLDATLFSKVPTNDRFEILKNNLKDMPTEEKILRKIR